MLKEVMMGAGGILLAAAIFASSVAPGPVAQPAPMTAPAAPVAVPPAVAMASPAPPPVVFADDSGDTQFGAPMIAAAPVDTGAGEPGMIDPGPISPDPVGGAEENGGRQFNAAPGRAYPIPK